MEINLSVDVGDILLALFDHLRLEGRMTVLWNVILETAKAAVYLLVLMALAGIVVVGTLGLTVAEVLVHLRLHHFLDGAAKKVFEGFLDVVSILNVILPKELLDEGSFSIDHFNLVNGFSLLGHDKGFL